PPAASGPKSYGTLAIGQPGAPAGKGSVWLKAWVYLAIAGFVGAFLAWASYEPFYIDGANRERTWFYPLFDPLVVVLMCLAYAIAESLVERSSIKAIQRGVLALIVGALLGFPFGYLTDLLYRWLLIDVFDYRHHSSVGLIILGRFIAWGAFGIVGGI